MFFNGNPLLNRHMESISAVLQTLSAEEIIALKASLTATGELLGGIMHSKIPSMSLPAALDAFMYCGNNSIRNALWDERLRDANELNPKDICSIVILTSRVRCNYHIRFIHEDTTELLFRMNDIETELVRIIQNVPSLRQRAFAKLLEQNPTKEQLMACLKIKDLRIPTFNLLTEKDHLNKDDLESLRDIPGIKVQVRRLLKNFG